MALPICLGEGGKRHPVSGAAARTAAAANFVMRAIDGIGTSEKTGAKAPTSQDRKPGRAAGPQRKQIRSASRFRDSTIIASRPDRFKSVEQR